MTKILTPVRRFFAHLNAKLNGFFYKDAYLFAICVATILLYVIGQPLLSLFVFSMAISVVLLCFRDFSLFMPLLITVMMPLRGFDVFSTPWAYVVLAPAVISLIAHFFIYPIEKFKLGKMFYPFVAISVALSLGGIFSPYASNYAVGLPISLTTGPMLLLIYLLFNNYFAPPENFDSKRYFALMLALLGVIITTQYFFHSFTYQIFYDSVYYCRDFMGWCNVNTSASIMLLCLPACCYLLSTQDKPALSLFCLLINYLSLLFIKSDVVICTIILFTPGLMIATYIRANKSVKNTLKYLYFLVAILAVLVACFILSKYTLSQLIDKFIKALFSDTGRTPLYVEGFNQFKKHPIFGVGQGFYDPNNPLFTTGVRLFNFHSVLVHVLATMGIVGFIAYLYYYVKRFRILMNNFSAFNLFLTFSFVMFQIYAFVDTSEFTIMPNMIIATLLILFVEIHNQPKKEKLPLTKKI